MRADFNTKERLAAMIAACSDADILVNHNAGPPPGRFDDWKRADWRAAIDTNIWRRSRSVRVLSQRPR
jgi:3-oxoacyl-[acyl-carrier protein] reductase